MKRGSGRNSDRAGRGRRVWQGPDPIQPPDDFIHDLKDIPAREVVRKHITTGHPAQLSPHVYYELRSRIADRFGLHPSAIVAVGSSRTGFSLKLKHGRRFVPFNDSSDIDLAIVSAAHFDYLWDQVFEFVRSDREWALKKGSLFARDLFCGWITPTKLPNLPRFRQATEWSEFFDQLTRSRLCDFHPIRARLYRSWERLELYQQIMVQECIRHLKLEDDL